MSVWDDHDNRIVQIIAEENTDEVSAFVQECGSTDVETLWNPDPNLMNEASIAEAIRYWHAACGDDDLPDYRAFDPSDLKPLLGNLLVIERVRQSDDLRYRLFGSLISVRYGEDRTGQSLTARNAGMAKFFNSAYRASLLRRELLFTRHAPPPDSRVKACQRLMMPFRGETETADRLIVANLSYSPDRRGRGLFPVGGI